MASLTLPSTGTPSRSWPALRALTPATTFVPAFSMRRVCLAPPEPVIPWTTILEFSVSQIATGSDRLLREFGGPTGRPVHRVLEVDDRQIGLGQDAAPLLDVVAVQPYDERLRGAALEHAERLDDAVGHRVAGRDATEDVDEHRLHGRVAEDHREAVRHHLRRSATTDVEEVRRL